MNEIIDLETLRTLVLSLLDPVRFALPLLRGWATARRNSKKEATARRLDGRTKK